MSLIQRMLKAVRLDRSHSCKHSATISTLHTLTNNRKKLYNKNHVDDGRSFTLQCYNCGKILREY